jgi:hypothetical protein
MKTYVANIVSSQLVIQAEDEAQAEEKYDAFFSGDPCPCGKDECDCCSEEEDVFHYMETQ